MTKKEQRKKAKDILQSVIGVAYYKLENEDIPEADKEAIMQYINQYGKAACKAFGVRYVAY